MRNGMKKVLACIAVLAIAMSMLGSALAAQVPSKAFKLPAVKARPTAAPAEEPKADPTREPAALPEEEIAVDAPRGPEAEDALKDKLDPDRYIDIRLATAQEDLIFGEEATLVAELHGYDNAVYTLQWQTSLDGETWTDVPGATDSSYTVVVSEENYMNYWQIQVKITDVLKDASEVA